MDNKMIQKEHEELVDDYGNSRALRKSQSAFLLAYRGYGRFRHSVLNKAPKLVAK